MSELEWGKELSDLEGVLVTRLDVTEKGSIQKAIEAGEVTKRVQEP